MVVWLQNGFKCASCLTPDRVADWELPLRSISREYCNFAEYCKIQKVQFLLNAYCFHANVKLNNH